jgi:hypothetical protein
MFNLQEIKDMTYANSEISIAEQKDVIISFIQSRLSNLKSFLSESDYQVIKCYEAFLLNQETPYNLEELLGQRKAWRDEINILEEEINTLKFEISMLG